MNAAMPTAADLRRSIGPDASAETAERSGSASGVSWAAIIAGAAGAAALSLILLIAGTGLGLSSVSPWSGQGAGAVAFGVSTIVWLTFTQIAASGMGGYLAGRLRGQWVSVHTDEVYFRDTAHGFLAWAVATLVTAAVLSSAIASILGAGAQAGASLTGGALSTAAAGATGAGAAAARSDASPSDMGLGYFVDSLFRRDPSTPPDTATPPAAPSTAEVARIFANDLRAGALAPEDASYVGQLVAQRTGLSPQASEKRVTEVFGTLKSRLDAAGTAARDAADAARKASAGVALWLFISLLIGAFVASLAATFGGRRRDL